MAQNKPLTLWEQHQKAYLKTCLINHDWKVRTVAATLGLYRSFIYRKMQRFGLKRPKTR